MAASGNDFDDGSCDDDSIPQGPVNIDLTNANQFEFATPLTCNGFKTVPPSATFSNDDGFSKFRGVFRMKTVLTLFFP